MQKHIIYFILGIIFCSNAITFDKTFGGSSHDRGYSVKQTSDGGYIAVGTTDSYGAGDYDGYIIKTDSTGTVEWEEVLGDSLDDNFVDVIQTDDDGFIAVGNKDSEFSYTGYSWIVKYDKNGHKKNETVFYQEGTNSSCTQIMKLPDDNYFISGGFGYESSYTHFLLLKIDNKGDILWNKEYQVSFGYAESVAIEKFYEIQDTYLLMADLGGIAYSGELEFKIIDFITGNELGNKFLSYSWSSYSSCRSIKANPDGTYILTGSAYADGSQVGMGIGYHVLLMKIGSNLEEIWSKNYGERILSNSGTSLVITQDQNICVLGYNQEIENDREIFLTKFDPDGNILWDRKFGSINNDLSYGHFQETSDNGFIFTGTMDYFQADSKLYLVKTDEFGNVIYPPTITYFENDSNNVTLNWDIVSNAGSYVVYGSDRPDSNFTAIDTTVVNTWNTTTSDSTFKKFYHIKSRTENLTK